MFPQLATRQTRNSFVAFLFSRHKSTHITNKKPSPPIFFPGKQGYDTTKFSPPPPPKKSNKTTKQESKFAKKKGNRVIAPPKLASESSFKFDDKKRFKNELKLKRFEYSSQQSIDDNNRTKKLQQSREELESEQRNEWYKKREQERKEKLDKINETIKILSLSSYNPKEFCTDEYREAKRKNALENYRMQKLEKRRERRLNLLTLYYNSSDFVNLNNLDTKIAEMYNEVRQPFTTTLEDMQIDYLEGGGIVDDLELKRRLDRIKDTLNDTAQGGKQKLGLDKIEKLYARKLLGESEENLVQPLNSNVETEPNLVQLLDS